MPDHRFDYARFLNVRRAYGPSFSPDGRRIAFIADITGVPQAWTISPSGGWPEQITFTQERIGLVSYAPDQARLVVAGDVGGDEREALWLLSARGEEMRALTHDSAAMHPFGAWSPDGRRIAYAGNGRDPRAFDLYVLEVDTGETRRVLETDGNYRVECWSPDGERLIVSLARGSFDEELYDVTVATGERRHLTPHDGEARFHSPCCAPDGRTIYLLTDRDGDHLALARLDRETLALEVLLDLGWDLELLSLSPDGSQMAYAVNVDGRSELFVREAGRGRIRQLQVPTGVIARGFVGNLRDTLAWSPDGTAIAFSLTTARETQNVWIADVASGHSRRLTHASQAGIPVDDLVDARLVHYPTFDGRQIPAFLYQPVGAVADGSRGAVVVIHGGPEAQVRPGFDPTVQYLVHRGYVVLTPNVRGSTGYGKAYSHLDDVDLRMDAVADVNAAAAWLADEGLAHRRRIAAMGQSYGGYMVLACLCTDPDVWAAGVDVYGIADFVSFLENTHPFRRAHREAEYGSLAHDRAVLERISPLRQVERIRAPLMAIHGEKDPRVPIGETEQIVAALEARGIPTAFIRLPDEGHGIVKLANRLRVWPAVADFLDRHLGGGDG